MNDTWVLLDPQTGLHVRWYFWLRVLDEVNRSARYGAPFALLLMRAESSSAAPVRQQTEAAARVPQAVRSTDLAGLLGQGRVGVLLMHQTAASAGQARDRVVDRLRATLPKGIEWKVELLTYPEDAAEISNLLTAGWPAGAASPDRRRPA